jgi:hypothetical protein
MKTSPMHGSTRSAWSSTSTTARSGCWSSARIDKARLLELVAVPAADPTRIIHADLLREKFYEYLR